MYTPKQIAAALRADQVAVQAVITALVDAYIGAIQRYPRVVIAHPFSVLPKCGVSEDALPDVELERLLEVARRRAAVLQIDEQWRCPSARVVAAAQACGVEVWSSTDAHQPRSIGVYSWAISEHGGAS